MNHATEFEVRHHSFAVPQPSAPPPSLCRPLTATQDSIERNNQFRHLHYQHKPVMPISNKSQTNNHSTSMQMNRHINGTDNKITNNKCKSAGLSKEIWRKADAVCFDVDSTVCCDEAIDELAKYVGKSQQVSDLTRKAMMGGMNFREALSKRLDIMKPGIEIISDYLETHKPRLTPYVEELIAQLHKSSKHVYLISGGFDVLIKPAADRLGISMDRVYANSIKYYHDGSYAGFDETRPTSNQDGKSRVISMLKQTKGYKNVVMIGDGVTDLEACPPADAFIGFGGNQIRETVRNNSDWFVYSFEDLITELPHCDRNL